MTLDLAQVVGEGSNQSIAESVQLVIEPVPVEQKDLLRNLMQAYLHDMSEYFGDDPDDMGSFDVGTHFDLYWAEPERHPLKITVNRLLVGFALVRELDDGVYELAEFFILRRHRRSGLGKAAAWQLFDRFQGTWHVAEGEHYVPAQKFWRKAIGEYTKGFYQEQWSEQPRGPKQVFNSTDA